MESQGDIRIPMEYGHKKLRTALLAGLLCGAVSVLVDTDHIIAYLAGWNYLVDRPFHLEVLIGSGIVLLACCTYIGRLYLQLVLKKRERSIK